MVHWFNGWSIYVLVFICAHWSEKRSEGGHIKTETHNTTSGDQEAASVCDKGSTGSVGSVLNNPAEPL